MSARGARSRKAIQKDIEKKETKTAKKQKQVEAILRPHDAFNEWRATSTSNYTNSTLPQRTVTISSDASRGSTSRSSSTHGGSSGHKLPRLNRIDSNESTKFSPFHRPATSTSRRTSLSEDSIGTKEKKKYQAKAGKVTTAPRGRGGGVPVKKPVSQSPAPPVFRAESTLPLSSPNTKTWINFRIWQGGEGGMRPYGGFDYDEDMQDGNVLIYFKEEQPLNGPPVPQIRCDFETLQNAGSTWLNNALLYGQIDENEDEWTLPGSPGESSTASPSTSTSRSHAISPNFRHAGPPMGGMEEAYYGVPGGPSTRNFSRQGWTPDPQNGGPFAPPPQQQPPQPATHELWFTAPSHVRTPQGQRLHHVAIRNFLAMLHNKPIVGADLFEMLSTLQPEIQVMYDLDHDERSRLNTARERSCHLIIQYLKQHGLDDVRHSIKRALGLLAWAEQDNVRWRQGYLESFVHLVGIMSPQLEDSPDFKRLSMGTRRNLGLAAKSLQLQVMEAEEKLASFDFGDLWEEQKGKVQGNPVYAAYQAFRMFLVEHYKHIYGSWPPGNSKAFLNRKMVRSLQEDFGSLYDYLVDREVIWDSREERPGKKWRMQHQKHASDFNPDAELGVTDMLVTWDSRHGYLHLPHPYPLLPREVPGVAKKETKKGFWGGLKKRKGEGVQDAKKHLQLSIVFSDATNIERLDAGFRGSALIDAFENFELTSSPSPTSSSPSSPSTGGPRSSRLGRWLLLYPILQTLSTLSVDVPGLRFTAGVRSFLCAEVKRCPEWVTEGNAEHLEARQDLTYCWTRQWSSVCRSGEPVELEADVPGGPGPIHSGVGGIGGIGGIGTMADLDGATMMDHDIRRISEKIDSMTIGGGRTGGGPQPPPLSLPPNMRPYGYTGNRRLENEKSMREEVGFSMKRDQSFRLTESDFQGRERALERESGVMGGGGMNYGERERAGDGERRPSVPSRNPMREGTNVGVGYPGKEYYAEERRWN